MPITEIANQLGISPSTVSRSLNNHPAISKKTKKAVLKLTKKLNYQPNVVALNLLKKRTNTISVIVPEITSYFFSSVINGIQGLVKPLGLNMIIGQIKRTLRRGKKYSINICIYSCRWIFNFAFFSLNAI